MKTSELVSKLNELGYPVKKDDSGLSSEYLAISTADNCLVAKVYERYYGVLNTDIDVGYNESQEHNPILKTIIDYAMTPLDKREGTKKYLVHLVPGEDGYLNSDLFSDELLLAGSDGMGDYQTEFSEQEYDELQSEYSQWLPKFDKDDVRFEEEA